MRVLLVEDDEALAGAMRQGLADQGFAVDVATSGAAARGFLETQGYDCMVLDLGLPDEDGLRLLEERRAAGDELPVLVVTARGSVPERVRGLDLGADDYLGKPFAFPEFVARVRAVMRRAGPFVPSALVVGDLELDAARFRVRRGSATIALTAKEFAILECLMRHAGQLVTRSMLLDRCWDASYEGLSNLVDVHVGRIRRKLDEVGGPPLIHTIRGAGFLLAAEPP